MRRCPSDWVAGEVRPGRRHRLGVHAGQQASGRRPGLGGGVTTDDVEPDAEPQRSIIGASGVGGQGADAFDPFSDHGGRLAPGQVHVDVAGRHGLGLG